jgi:hypothetical protein
LCIFIAPLQLGESVGLVLGGGGVLELSHWAATLEQDGPGRAQHSVLGLVPGPSAAWLGLSLGITRQASDYHGVSS